jgi:hypothetical protein
MRRYLLAEGTLDRADPSGIPTSALPTFICSGYAESVPMFEKAVRMNPPDETFTGNLADAYRWKRAEREIVGDLRHGHRTGLQGATD